MNVASSKLRQVADWLADTQRPSVAFTGAGISTESGVPDFRSPGGVWAKNQPVLYDDFLASAAARYEYWRQKSEAHLDMADAQPNVGHRALSDWEKSGQLQAVITQNIDGLHQLAGSSRVLELHGTARQVVCLDCRLQLETDPLVEDFRRTDRVPPCPTCGGRLKHATISFGQALPSHMIDEAAELSTSAGVYLAIGSSLVVHPAASLPEMAKRSGSRLVIVNRDPTPLDAIADVVIHEPIGQVLSAIGQILSGAGP